MSYKIGLILSMIFVALFFAFGIDLITVQFVFSNLDAQSVAISYRISQHGTIDENLINEIENKYHENQVNKVVTISSRDGKQVGKAIIIIDEDYFNDVVSKLEEVYQLQLEGNFFCEVFFGCTE